MMRSVKLKAGSAMEVSDFRRMAAFSNMNSMSQYSISCPEFSEFGYMANGVTYPNSGQAYRTLHLIVPDTPKPPVVQRESYTDEDGTWHMFINI